MLLPAKTVQLTAGHPDFWGAEHLSNNTAELTACCEAFAWVRDHAPAGLSVVLLPDSAYAEDVITGNKQAHRNLVLVRQAASLLASLRA